MVSKSGFVGGTSLSDTAKSSGNLVVNGNVLYFGQWMKYLTSPSLGPLLINQLFDTFEDEWQFLML